MTEATETCAAAIERLAQERDRLCAMLDAVSAERDKMREFLTALGYSYEARHGIWIGPRNLAPVPDGNNCAVLDIDNISGEEVTTWLDVTPLHSQQRVEVCTNPAPDHITARHTLPGDMGGAFWMPGLPDGPDTALAAFPPDDAADA